MDPTRLHRPRISRETRLLLVTALVAVAALWVLARVRFPDSPATPNPVQPLLTQLTVRPALTELAGEVLQLQPRLEPFLVVLDLAPPALSAPAAWARTPYMALRVRDDLAVVLLDGADPETPSPAQAHPPIVGFDQASSLAVVRVPGPPAPPPVPWRAADLEQPRYLIAADASTLSPSLYPVFVGSLAPVPSPVWRSDIWLAPALTDLTPGSFVFTSDGLLAGLAVNHEGRVAIVPGGVLLAEAERLAVRTLRPKGHLGVEIQALSPSVASATGTTSGVVVTWVDPDGPAAELLSAGDVIETVNGREMLTPLHWAGLAERLTAGESIAIRARRGGEITEVPLVAGRAPVATPTSALGLTLRVAAGRGAEVVDVEPGSVADLAGLRAGDLITRIDQVAAPSPAAVRETFDDTLNGEAVLVAFTRGETHRVTALEKW